MISHSVIEALCDNAANGSVVADKNGIILHVNNSLLSMLGYTEDSDLVGKDIKVLMPEAYHISHSAAFSDFLQTGEMKRNGRPLRVDALKVDGSTIPCVVRVVATKDEKGDTLLLGYLMDATTIAELEETINKMGLILEKISEDVSKGRN